MILFSVNRFFHLSMDTIVTATIMSQYAKTGVGSIVYSVINSVGNLSTVLFCMAVGKFLDLSVSNFCEFITCASGATKSRAPSKLPLICISRANEQNYLTQTHCLLWPLKPIPKTGPKR